MTIYNYKNSFDETIINNDDYCSCVDTTNPFVRRVDNCIWECYEQVVVCGDFNAHSNYSRQTWCYWPLPKKIFEDRRKENHSWCASLKKYKDYEEYINDTPIYFEEADSSGMCQIYSLLDNFHSYYGAVQDDTTVTVLSIGSCLGYTGSYNQEKLSEGFGLVINKLNNDIHLVTLGEDDGNYWASHEVPYSNLSLYDRNEVISIINDIPEEKFWNKQELINKLWRF